MKNQERTIIGACDYSIASLQKIKASLLDYGNPKKEINWAIGGVIISLTSYLLRTCHNRILESVETGEPDAKKDLKFIQQEFNRFVDEMVNQE